MAKKRDGEVRFRATREDLRKVRALVRFYKVTTSDVLRQLVDERFHLLRRRAERAAGPAAAAK